MRGDSSGKTVLPLAVIFAPSMSLPLLLEKGVWWGVEAEEGSRLSKSSDDDDDGREVFLMYSHSSLNTLHIHRLQISINSSTSVMSILELET